MPGVENSQGKIGEQDRQGQKMETIHMEDDCCVPMCGPDTCGPRSLVSVAPFKVGSGRRRENRWSN